MLTILLSNGRKGPRCKKSHILTSSTACDNLSPQARGADPKQRCLELKTELEQNYKACTLYIFVHPLFFTGFLFNCLARQEKGISGTVSL